MEGLESVPMHVQGYGDARQLEGVTLYAQRYGISGNMRNQMLQAQQGYRPPVLSHAQARMPSFWQFAKLTSTGNPAALTISGSLESINDFYITGKALLSGPLGYSKTGWRDLFDEPVGTEKRLSAGVNSLTLPVFLINPEARVAAEVGGVDIVGTNFSKVLPTQDFIPGKFPP